MRLDRVVLVVLATLALSRAARAEPLNVASVGIGAPQKAGEYTLLITYLDKDGNVRELDATVNVNANDSATTKRDNLLAALQTKLTNLGIEAFTVAAAGTSSITVTSGALPRKILNVWAYDFTGQANTYTIEKQTPFDKHDVRNLFLMGASGARGGGTVSVAILGGSASVTTTRGMQGAQIAAPSRANSPPQASPA